MGLYNTLELRKDMPLTFENDGYELNIEMIERYRNSKMCIENGQMLPRETYFCKNVSIFDLTGTKIFWGDIAPEDVRNMMGIYYILTEHTSYWNPPKSAVKLNQKNNEDINSKSSYRHLLPEREAVALDIDYIKRNAIARINDGAIETSKDLIMLHYQVVF